jgi:hypothetical protein
VGLSEQQLDDVFRRSPPGPVPVGVGVGTAIVVGPSPVPALAARIAPLGWRGKVFDPSGHALVNRIGPFGLRAIGAVVTTGPSLLDGEPAIVLDYSRSSVLARAIRDEMREVGPGVYLGIVYWSGRKTVNFALAFDERAA